MKTSTSYSGFQQISAVISLMGLVGAIFMYLLNIHTDIAILKTNVDTLKVQLQELTTSVNVLCEKHKHG